MNPGVLSILVLLVERIYINSQIPIFGDVDMPLRPHNLDLRNSILHWLLCSARGFVDGGMYLKIDDDLLLVLLLMMDVKLGDSGT